jgi:hypothetical protein
MKITLLRLLLITSVCAWLVPEAAAEALMPGVLVERAGARFGGFFDAGASATVTLTVPPGVTSAPETMRVEMLALTTSHTTVTSALYDPATTWTLSLPVNEHGPGPHYVVLRLPSSRLMQWTWFTLFSGPQPLPVGDVSTATLLARSDAVVLAKHNLLYDEDSTGTWLANDPATDYRWMREDVYFADSLLRRGDAASVARANALIQAVCAARDPVTTSPSYGMFFANGTDRRVPDNAVTHFAAPILASWLLRPPAGLTPHTLDAIREALLPAVEAQFMTHAYGPRYQNFYLFSVATLAQAGSIFGNPAFTNRARARLQLMYDNFIPNGGPAESNSPVYCAPSQWALSLLLRGTSDPVLLAQASILRERLWLDTAAFVNPVTRHLSGPYSRVAEDALRGGAGLTAFMMASELGWEGLDSPGRLGEMLEAFHALDINPAGFIASLPAGLNPLVRTAMRERLLPDTVWQRNFWCDTVAHLTDEFTLGTSSATHDIGSPEGFVLQVADTRCPGGIASAWARVGSGAANDPLGYRGGIAHHIHAVQSGRVAAVFADHVLPAGTPNAQQLFFRIVFDERFGAWEGLQVGGMPVDLPVELTPDSMVTMRRGGVFAGWRPLYAETLGPRARAGVLERRDGHLALSLFSLDSATSLPVAGLRIEAGVGVACERAADWPSYEAFVADFLGRASVSCQTDTTSRTVHWSNFDSVDFLFDRVARNFVNRLMNGAPPPGALLQCRFATQTAGSSLALRDFAADGCAPWSWVVYPPGATEAVLVNPAETTAVISTSWTSGTLVLAPYSVTRVSQPVNASVNDWRAHSGDDVSGSRP